MSNLIGSGNNVSSGGSGGGGGALIAVPLIVVASFSLKSGLVEGCGRQAAKNAEEFAPVRFEKNYNQYPQPFTPPNKPFGENTYPFEPHQGGGGERPGGNVQEELQDF